MEEEEEAVSTRKRSRFEARRNFGISHPPRERDATIETLIFKAAMNFPYQRIVYPEISTFTPCFATTMYYLSYMDTLMASTKKWTDNCNGWVPPYSQIYISILLYIQTFRAMERAGLISSSSETLTLLRVFQDHYSLKDLYIPGPLVQAFKNLSCFTPTGNRFGNLTPGVPSRPRWSEKCRYRLRKNLSTHLPHIHLFSSRLRTVCAAATRANATEATFRTDVNGPCNLASLFNQNCDNGEDEIANLTGPGASFAYAGNLRLWQDAAARVEDISVPVVANEQQVRDSWVSFLGFEESMAWFGPLSDMMAEYCRFWRGSAPLDECSPNCSASGGVICTESGGNMFAAPRWNDNDVGHYTMRNTASLEFSAATTIEDIAKVHLYASSTYNFNLIPAQGARDDYLTGPFWSIALDVLGVTGVQITQGVLSTISREYHCDSRIHPGRSSHRSDEEEEEDCFLP